MDNDTSDQCINALFYQTSEFLKDDPIIAGIVVILVFYVLIFVVGILASKITKMRQKKYEVASPSNLSKVEDLVLAGKSMGTVVGIFTMTATLIGGALTNGTAEMLIDPKQGLIWCQAPFCYAISLIMKSLIFVKPMFKKNYRTFLDPIEDRYGRIMTFFAYLAHMLVDIFWSSAILTALGSSLSVIVGMNYLWSVVISAAVVVVYVFIGGLYSVAYTDIIQLFLYGLGLWLAVPFAMTHDAVTPISETASNPNSTWLGQPPEGMSIALYIDIAFVMLAGDFCWQPSYQRLLAMKTARQAQIVAVFGGLFTIVFLIPVFLLGGVAFSTDWNATDYALTGVVPVPECNYALALPMVMRYLTPIPVAVVGLGAVCAAVMSSADSAFLSSATLITLNIYTPFRAAVSKGKSASDTELLWVMRGVVVVVGAIATIISLLVAKTYGFLILGSDCLYMFLLPQIVGAVFLEFTNTYGALVAFWFGVTMRFLSGDPMIGLPTVIYWPYAEGEMQYFPYRTVVVILSTILLVVISLITRECAKKFECCRKIDAATFRCFVSEPKSSPGKYYLEEIDNGETVRDEKSSML